MNIVHHDQTRATFKQNIQPRDSSHIGGFFNLKIATAAIGGYTTCSFELSEVAPYSTRRFVCYDSIEVWGYGQRIWTGRVARPVKQTSEGTYLIECEGIGVAWAKDYIATIEYVAGGRTTHNYASEIYADMLTNFPINLLNSDTSLIGATNYSISKRDWRETTYETCFNELNNFHQFQWGVGIYSDEGNFDITDGGNRFYFQDLRAASNVTWTVDYRDLESVDLELDMDGYANWVRVRYGSNLSDYRDGTTDSSMQDTVSQAKYSPGRTVQKAFSVNSGSSTATSADAVQVGAAYLNRRKIDGVVEPWLKGSITLTGEGRYLSSKGFQLPAYLIKAGQLIRIQGLIENQPELSDSVSENSVFMISQTEYDEATGKQVINLNDYPPDVTADIARIDARTA